MVGSDRERHKNKSLLCETSVSSVILVVAIYATYAPEYTTVAPNGKASAAQLVARVRLLPVLTWLSNARRDLLASDRSRGAAEPSARLRQGFPGDSGSTADKSAGS